LRRRSGIRLPPKDGEWRGEGERKNLEKAFGGPDGPVGWQHSTLRFGRDAEGKKVSDEPRISDGTVAFWTTFLLVTLAVAIWETVVTPHGK